MATSKVGIREFRDNLSSYLLESESPVAITRHGDTVGYYIPARRRRSESERDAMRQVATRMQQMLAAHGVSEEEVLRDYKSWRKSGRK
jgi:antitoxin (DNA-binding transcriptional repressor) of toxin-antitoxin stability system